MQLKKLFLKDISGFKYQAETEDGVAVVGQFSASAEDYDFSEVTVETAVEARTQQKLSHKEYDLWDLANQIEVTGDAPGWFYEKKNLH